MTEEEKKEASKKYREENKEKISAQKKVYHQINKEKIAAQKKIYFQENREEFRRRAIKYVEKQGREKINKLSSDYSKKRRENEPELCKAIVNNYVKTRRQNDNLYRLTTDIRTIIGKALRKQNYKKISKTSDILGCSFEHFKTYLESKFEPWMNWQNRGLFNGELNYGWDIDHIVPLDTAITENEIIKLNHYTNLQPLCSKINRHIKRNKKAT